MVKDGVTLLIDPMSYQYLVGAEIDYQEGLEGAQFVIKNPNATTHLRLRIELLGLIPGLIPRSDSRSTVAIAGDPRVPFSSALRAAAISADRSRRALAVRPRR